MKIISDTTPIISLLKAGRLELLQQMFTEVLVPEAVYGELISNKIFEEEAELCLLRMKECGIRMSHALYGLVLDHIERGKTVS